jgi:hypothetical protein
MNRNRARGRRSPPETRETPEPPETPSTLSTPTTPTPGTTALSRVADVDAAATEIDSGDEPERRARGGPEWQLLGLRGVGLIDMPLIPWRPEAG